MISPFLDQKLIKSKVTGFNNGLTEFYGRQVFIFVNSEKEQRQKISERLKVTN